MQASKIVSNVDNILEGEELIKALVQQVEIIFSRENLMSDYNIVSKMNGDMCVNISVVLESPRISKLTTDASHLLTAMRQTNKVILDEATSTVKPSFKLQRNTIIIRDVAPDTPQEVRIVKHTLNTLNFFLPDQDPSSSWETIVNR